METEKQKPEYPEDVTFALEVEQDAIFVRGNALASGDDAVDKEAEDEIFRRLDNGDVWAWACVTMKAKVSLPSGTVITGRDHLSGCNFKDEAGFKESGYYDGMKSEAFQHLLTQLRGFVEDGRHAGEMLTEWGFAPA